MSLQIKVEGLEELQSYLHKDAPDAIKQGVIDSLTDLSYDIYNTTTSLCPIDTGALLKSIDVKTAYDEVTAIAGKEYASYVDNGTRFMEAQPFFEKPINEILLGFTTKLETMIDKVLRK